MRSETSATTKSLVVAAASRHGSTCEIADRIAQRLSQVLPQWHVTRADLGDLPALDGADAVIVGSAIYYGRWMRPAAEALAYLRERPPASLWLFSTGPVSEVETENEETLAADAMADIAEGDEHMVFGGRLDASGLSMAERLVVKAVHALPGDHRNWTAVEAWADHIAGELNAQPGRTKGTSGQGIGL